MASVLVISLIIIQRQSVLLIFKIEILVRLLNIIEKWLHPLQTFGWNLNPLFKKYQ